MIELSCAFPPALDTPDHIVLAGELGLGNFDRDQIWHRRVTLA